MKINLINIPTVSGHNNSVFKKPLIAFGQKKGKVATFNYAWLEKGMKVEPHRHDDGEEYYLFLSGKGKMLIGEKWFDVVENDYVTIPQGSMHSLVNEDEKYLTFLSLRTIN